MAWRIIGGAWFVGILFWEFLFYCALYYFTKDLVFMEAIMGYVCQNITVSNEHKKFWQGYYDKSGLLVYYHIFSTIIYVNKICIKMEI